MRLILVRHGQSLGNVEQRIQGADDPLTDLGRQQANLAGLALAARNDLTHLYASDLDRALETANIIGCHVRLQPMPAPGFAEIDAGVAIGQRWAEWIIAFPEQAAKVVDQNMSPFGQWEGGETGQQLSDRVLAAYETVVGNHLGTDDVVTVVTHGGPLGWIAAKIYGDPLDIWPSIRGGFHNCSISEVDIDPTGTPTVIQWNTNDHLASLTP